MKTIRTQQIVKAFILLKRRRVSTADRVYIAFKLKSIKLDKQFERMMKKMEVKIKLLPGGKMPTKGSAGAAAFDCYASEDIDVEDFPRLIGLGFALELPPGYHAKIFPRSSTGLKTGLRQPNSCGIIDSDYRGEVKAMYESKLNASYEGGCGCTVQHIKAGDRIAQMLIERNVDVEFVVVDELSETDRGAGGFGSTGIR